MTWFSGYPIDDEPRDQLEQLAMGIDYDFSDVELPEQYGHDWQKVENQARFNSCGGNAGSSAAECLVYLAHRDTTQLSRWFCYITAQIHSGLRGDSGVYMAGVHKALRIDGICPESVVPYPSSYHRDIAAGREVAKEIRVTKAYRFTSRQQFAQHVASGQGVALVGTPWFESYAQAGETITRRSRNQLGGHAYYFDGYKMIGGEIWPRLCNSHGTGWGHRGRAYMHPDLFDWHLEDRSSSMFLITDLETPTPRPLDWTAPENSIGRL